MEIALSNYLGKQDIITPINLEEEILRYKNRDFSKNYSSNKKKKEDIIDILKVGYKKIEQEF